MRQYRIARWLGLAMGLALTACATDGPLTSGKLSTVTMQFLTPATVRSIVVEVSGPGIDPAVLLNLSVGPDTVAAGSLTLPSGSGRRFLVTAVDTAGVVTHRADTTITLQPGTNPNLAMRLEPLPGSLGITVTFGGVRLTVSDSTLRTIDVGDSTSIVASAMRADGSAVPTDSLVWATANPAAVRVAEGRVHGLRAGETFVTVSFKGAAARVGVRVVNPWTPSLLDSLVEEASRGWFNTSFGMSAVGPLSTQAQTYTASWNNYSMNFYSSLDADGTRLTRAWRNSTSQIEYASIEWFWNGHYTTIGQAAIVLRAIRQYGATLGSTSLTRAGEAMSLLLQGASLAGIALHYDQGFLTAETTTGATLVNRRVMRDAALQKLDSAIGLADTAVFTTPASWTNGTSYSSQSVARIGRTMAALLLANWPRNPTENAAVDWGRVASYAQRGMSEGTPLDFRFTADGCNRWCPEVTSWFNDPTTGRVHTRVSALLDPSQIDPWPIGGNPRPNSADRRLGDGSYGTVEDSVQFWTVPRTASAGTDFAYSSESPFNPSRGSYHQSNIAHIRYALPGTSFGTPVGTIPAMSATQNDLVWAEALVRSGGSAALAATLINRSRVGRGGLPAAAAGEGSEALLAHWSYESELELLGLSSAPFLFRRRTASLVTGTPLEMPVPVRVLNTLGLGTYTWGGAVVSSPTPP